MIGQHLKEEHDEIRAHIARIREVADLITDRPTKEIHEGVEAAKRFLRLQLLPHAEVEERVLYPAVAELLGDQRSTSTMSEDHAAIGALVDELDEVRSRHMNGPGGPPPLADLRRILYSLHALVTLHLTKEEHVYIPILETGLNESETRELLENVEKEAEKIHADLE